MLRRSLLAMALIALVTSLAVAGPGASLPVSAAPEAFTLTMTPGTGILQIRDAEEPAELGSPTTLTGTVDEGTISGVTLTTPPATFETEALGLPVVIDTTFVQVTPGGGSGSISGDGALVVRDTLRAELDIVINGSIEAFCVAEPVAIDLTSTAPYTVEAGATIRDADFSVPEVPVTEECPEIVANGVNDKLAGGGHSLGFRVTGDLELPPVGFATTTTLAVSPAGQSPQAVPVTMTATVAEVGSESGGVTPTGQVEFKDGSRSLGVADVEGGTATLTTSSLAPGEHQLSAAYSGDAAFALSASAPTAHTVVRAPVVTTDAPGRLVPGGAPTEFTVDYTHPGGVGAGRNARLDVLIAPYRSVGGFTNNTFVVERETTPGTWERVTLTRATVERPAGPTAAFQGSVGPVTGEPVVAGQPVSTRLRISAAPSAPFATFELNLDLALVDASDGANPVVVAGTGRDLTVVPAERAPSSVAVAIYDPSLRPGHQLYVEAYVSTDTGRVATGLVEILIDGRRVDTRGIPQFGGRTPALPAQPVEGGFSVAYVDLPADLTSGPHLISARYLGDDAHRGSSSPPQALTIDDPLGALYECTYAGSQTIVTGAYVRVETTLPRWVTPGDPAPVEADDVELVFGGVDVGSLLQNLPTTELQGVEQGVRATEVTLGDRGRLTGAVVGPYENAFDGGDEVIVLEDLAGDLSVTGRPGDRVDVPVSEVVLTGAEPLTGADFAFTCLPTDDAEVIGQVGVSGVELDVAPGPVVVVGDPVTLTATVAPAFRTGRVEFFDGETSLGFAGASSGSATLDVDDLATGSHAITAVYTGSSLGSVESDVVTVQVVPRPTSAAAAFVTAALVDFTGGASAADIADGVEALGLGQSRSAYLAGLSTSDEYLAQVVDQLYLDTLGREGDAGGVAFWVARLRSGWSVARVAASFYRSDEYFAATGGTSEVWIEDLYSTLLGRASEPDGLAYWVGQVDAIGRGAVALRFFQSRESAEFRVTDLYAFFLDRPPLASDLDYWAPIVVRRGDLALAVNLAASAEYLDRAQDRFPVG